MTAKDEEERYTFKSARYLLNAIKDGLPKGETKETVSEFLEVHHRLVSECAQRTGKGRLLLEIGLARKNYRLLV